MSDERSGIIPAWCPICDLTMKGSLSNRTYAKWGCCMHCEIEFIEHREERWLSGWRPTAEQVTAFLKKMNR